MLSGAGRDHHAGLGAAMSRGVAAVVWERGDTRPRHPHPPRGAWRALARGSGARTGVDGDLGLLPGRIRCVAVAYVACDDAGANEVVTRSVFRSSAARSMPAISTVAE